MITPYRLRLCILECLMDKPLQLSETQLPFMRSDNNQPISIVMLKKILILL